MRLRNFVKRLRNANSCHGCDVHIEPYMCDMCGKKRGKHNAVVGGVRGIKILLLCDNCYGLYMAAISSVQRVL